LNLSPDILNSISNARRPKTPTAGEATGNQAALVGPGLVLPNGMAAIQYQAAGGSPFAMPYGGIGSMLNTAYPGMGMGVMGGFWSFGANGLIQPRKGSYATYRMMNLDPTIGLVRRFIRGPILTSQWTAQAVKGKKPKQAWIDLIEDQILPLRMGIIRECLGMLDFGWMPFERVYEITRGGPGEGRFYKLKKVKPLLPDYTQIQVDGHGNFVGLIGGSVGGLDSRKTWLCATDVQSGNLYGMSRHEGAYDPWVDCQYTRVRKALLAGKLSGNIPVVKYRPGFTPMAGGKYLMPDGVTPAADNYEIAIRMLDTLFAGKGVAVPTTDFTDSDLQENPKLADAVSWNIEFMDAGSYAPAMDGMIHESEYQDKLKIRGWGWPERAVIEAQAGGLGSSDSGNHGESASTDLEMIDDEISEQVSRGIPTNDVPGLVDELLALNFGEEARGSVEIQPAPLSDPKVQLYTDLLEAMYANPSLGSAFAEVTDWDDIFQHMDIKTVGKVQAKIQSLLAQARTMQQQKGMQPPDGRPGNGNGKMNGNGNGEPQRAGSRFQD
jgi:hypothetical protein